jgi:MarR family transcriptional repressor of emrRAB
MKTKDRLLAIDASAKSWQKGIPEFSIEDVTLMRLIRVASLGITAFIDPMLRPTGLTESSYHTLIVVLASGKEGTTPSTLSEQVGQNHANMTRILSVLASEKLIRVSPDARDARRRRIVATAAGRTLVRTYAARFEPIMKAAFASLSAADKRALQRTLRSLIESMDAAERMVGAAS